MTTPAITMAAYEQAERDIAHESARTGMVVHTAITVFVSALLVLINLACARVPLVGVRGRRHGNRHGRPLVLRLQATRRPADAPAASHRGPRCHHRIVVSAQRRLPSALPMKTPGGCRTRRDRQAGQLVRHRPCRYRTLFLHLTEAEPAHA